MITTYTYDKANRLQTANAGGSLTTYTYDAAGNRLSQQSSADTIYYTWDAQSRMTTAEPAAGIASFTYNADGQRTAKQSTDGSVTGFLYDYKKLLTETDDVGGEVSNLYATTTDQEFGDLISEDGDQLVHQYDAQACTNALLDSSGDVEATFKYYAFGQLAWSSILGDAWASLTVDQWATMTVEQWATLPLEIATAMGAMGQKQYYFDPETQLYLLGMGTNGRYYDAATGQFISEDPIRQAGGDTNLFEYVNNNPINRLDPSGHDGTSDDEAKRQQQLAEQQRKPAAPTAGAGAGAGAVQGAAAGAQTATKDQQGPPLGVQQGKPVTPAGADKTPSSATEAQAGTGINHQGQQAGAGPEAERDATPSQPTKAKSGDPLRNLIDTQNQALQKAIEDQKQKNLTADVKQSMREPVKETAAPPIGQNKKPSDLDYLAKRLIQNENDPELKRAKNIEEHYRAMSNSGIASKKINEWWKKTADAKDQLDKERARIAASKTAPTPEDQKVLAELQRKYDECMRRCGNSAAIC